MQAISPEAHGTGPGSDAPSGVRGWLLVLCLLLLVWEPVSFALTASRLLASLGNRDASVTVLLAGRLVVVGVGIGAGLALSRRQQQGVVLAQTYFVLSSALSVLLRGTSFFPSDLPPGMAAPAVALVLGYNVAWFIYLIRSARVHNTVGPPQRGRVERG